MAQDKYSEAEIAIQDVRIGWTNFSGQAGLYNKKGETFFELFLTPEQADRLAEMGYAVRYPEQTKENLEDEYEAEAHMRIKMKMDGARPPKIVIVNGAEDHATILDEETVGILDTTDIQKVDIVFRPYDWTFNADTGRSAWLKALYVTINKYAFDDKYNL